MKHLSKPSTPDIILLLLVAVIWGSSFPAIKVIVPELGPFWAAALRVGVGFVVLLPFFLFRPVLPGSLRQTAMIALIALLNMVIPFILISWAMNHIEAGVGSLLLGTTPFIAMILGHFLTRDEQITTRRVVAVFFAVSGVGILVGADAVLGLGSAAILAQVAVIAGGACYVVAGFAMRSMDMKPIPFTCIALGMGTLMLFAISFAAEGVPETPSNLTLLLVLWLGVFPTGLAYLLRYFLVKRVGVSTFALGMNAVPVFGIIIAAFTLGEKIEWTTLLALACILVGLLIARSGMGSNSGISQGKAE